MQFDWDKNKNNINIKKHKVDFNDVLPVFFDDYAISFEDNRYEYPDGQRMVIIGQSNDRLLYVAYADIDGSEIVRIISARKANKSEIIIYNQG